MLTHRIYWRAPGIIIWNIPSSLQMWLCHRMSSRTCMPRTSHPLKMAPKLTKKHMQVPAFSKLRINLTAQVLSRSIATGVAFLCQTGIFPASYMATFKFVQRFDSPFNINFSTPMAKLYNSFQAPPNYNITSYPFSPWKQKWLKTLQEMFIKAVENLPCISGYLQTIQALLFFANNTISDEKDIKFFLSNRLNQDCIENLCDDTKQKKGGGGYRNNPDPQEFRYALRQLMGQSVIVHSWHKLQGRFRHIFPQFHDTILNTNTVTSTSPCNPPPTSSTSPGSKSLVKSAKAEDIVQLVNVTAYIGSYM